MKKTRRQLKILSKTWRKDKSAQKPKDAGIFGLFYVLGGINNSKQVYC